MTDGAAGGILAIVYPGWAREKRPSGLVGGERYECTA